MSSMEGSGWGRVRDTLHLICFCWRLCIVLKSFVLPISASPNFLARSLCSAGRMFSAAADCLSLL